MFTKYEKSLKTFLKHYRKTNNRTMTSADFDIPRYKIDYLAAKGLIDIVPYKNGDPNCRITIADKGLTYFDEKQDKLFRFWIPVIISILALIGAYRQELVALLQAIVQLLK